MGKMAAAVTGAGIGVGVAVKFRESPLVIISAASAGMMGSFASQILAGTLLTESTVALSGPGEPLGAFIAALVGIEVGHLVSGKTKIDILVTPLVSIISGSTVGLLAGPPISSFMVWLGSLVNWGYRAAASFDGRGGVCRHGNRPHAAHQFRRPWHHHGSVRPGCRRRHHRLAAAT